MHKVCKGHCGETKDVTEFYRKPRYHLKYPNSDAGYTHTCQTCTKAVRKAYWLANKEKSKDATQNARLKRAYGIDLAQYNQLFSKQMGCCKTCKRPASEFRKGLVVDHSHVTGQVRGLLCTPCNLTLGYVSDNTQILSNLIDYLNSNSSIQTQEKVG